MRGKPESVGPGGEKIFDSVEGVSAAEVFKALGRQARGETQEPIKDLLQEKLREVQQDETLVVIRFEEKQRVSETKTFYYFVEYYHPGLK